VKTPATRNEHAVSAVMRVEPPLQAPARGVGEHEEEHRHDDDVAGRLKGEGERTVELPFI